MLKITIGTMAIGVVLVNQSLAMYPAGNNSLFNYSGSGLGGLEDQVTESGLTNTVNYYVGLSAKKSYVGFDTPLIPPDSNINSDNTSANDESSDDVAIVIINNNSLLASPNFDSGSAGVKQPPRKNVIVYEVKPGDTPSEIADEFGISTDTMLWANNLDLSSATKIKPGDKLVILPVSGVRHAVKKGETLASIGKKYSANVAEIIAYNFLDANTKLETDSVLIIPNGKMPVPPAPAKPKAILASTSKSNEDLANIKNINTIAGDTHPPEHGRRFPWGQCTYYVAIRRYVPWNGDAKNWLTNARAYGFKTGSTPVAGSIVVTNENRRYGHVAYVESVNDGKITISEMNFVGKGIKSVRVISAESSIIRGYIYNQE